MAQSVRQELILNEVDCVIATGAPFKYLYDLVHLKKEFPEVKFIADLRDPWTNTFAYGWERLSKERQKAELRYEGFVIENYDKVITVSPGIVEILRERYQEAKNIALIENGYDLDDLTINQSLKTNENVIRLIFAGTFYTDAYEYLELFVSGLNYYLSTRPNSRIEFKVDFYGAIDIEFENYINKVDCIEHHGKVSLNQVYQKLQIADYGLLFLSNEINYSISTKFCEYVLYNKPLIVFGSLGFTTTFVDSNELGWAISDENSWVLLLEELESLKAKNDSKIISRDSISHLNIESITDRLIEEINQIKID